ncbi:FkbM family methyltransferase [Dysgonomonas sp. 520]|uniref:FkbM family methyltransferase n=1 Tax=Dysgonomonas sp. 520 TaxID=2302931 RepID=UPI0013D53F4F|nr:FkbM family methyltransferase [Dysgonomonas sp. 520]NDW11020.1 FkbM family methyltransferase [Dysgonomonas sp. 520]
MSIESSFKRVLFKAIGVYRYLRILQKGFFFSYKSGFLKKNPSYDLHYFTRNMIESGDIVIDIGANLGYYSKLFSKWVGDKGKVYSVEPISLFNKAFLSETKKCKNIVLFSFALGDEEKDIELVTSTQDGYLHTGLAHVFDKDSDGKIEEQEFRFQSKMQIPDVLFKDIEHVDYVKCDVEGFEYTVLSNMQQTIDRSKPAIQIELWGQNKDKIFTLLTEKGYLAYRFSRTKGKLTSKGIESLSGDYIFIHKENEKYVHLIAD